MEKRQDKIRERRFILELWQMTSDFKELAGPMPLCQLAYFNASFYLNSIPQAVVAPLLGTPINENDNVNGVANTITFDMALFIAKNRLPVAVVLKVSHSFSSDLDNKVEDVQYWPKSVETSVLDYDGYGLYKAKQTIIFKGYILPPTINIVSNNAQIRLTLIHWLADIADISLLTTFCTTSVPTEFALQTYSTPTAEPTDNTWAIIQGDENSFKEPGSLWSEGIYNIFYGALSYYVGSKFFNNYTTERRVAILRALDSIVADSTLNFIENFTDNTNTFNCLVGMALKSENHQNFVNVTAWDKLIKQYAPAFLFSVVPTVNKAILIPTPSIEYLDNSDIKEKEKENKLKNEKTVINGREVLTRDVIPEFWEFSEESADTQNTEDEKIIIIKNNDILSVSSLPLSNLILNRLVCVPSEPTDVSRTPAGPPTYISLSTYPPEEFCSNRSGFVSTITYPSWIGLPVENKIDQPSKQHRPEDNPDDLIKDANTRLKELEGIKKIKQNIAEQFTRFAYLTQVYNSTWANITLPCRMDICPGAMVKCIIDNNIKYSFYGTVTGVMINILPGENTSNTQLSLTNIRVEELAKDDIENPQDSVGFYTKQWTGKGVTLYD